MTEEEKKALEDAKAKAAEAAEKAKKIKNAAKAAIAATSTINTIMNSIPSSLKAKGISKVTNLLLNQAVFIEQFLQKKVTELVQDKVSDLCLPADQVDKLIAQRNNLVEELNKVGKTLDTLTTTITGVSGGFNTLIDVITALKIAKTGASVAIKALPVLPGAVGSLISDLGDAIDTISFDNLGASKLQKIQDALSSTIVPVALIGAGLNTLISKLNELDAYLKKCAPSSTLFPSSTLVEVNPNIINIVASQQQSEQTTNQSTYQGFTIKIEEIPYNDSITRKRAVAYNSQGVPLITTELSFTSSDQTLINELKLIIDRDNLKAY
jgi:hypothetical protein